MRSRISALVPCGNEESVIRACLESVRWADEVLVVLDAASEDGSRAVCERLADRVLVHPYESYAAQNNWAIPRCSHPWVLLVDADERVTPALRARVLALLEEDGRGHAGFHVRRENLFYGRVIWHGGWDADYPLRLFRRDAARFEERRVHAPLRVEGSVGRIEEPLQHDTHRGMSRWLQKLDRYTTWAAADLHARGRRATWIQLLLRPAWRFLRALLLRGGLLDGVRGLLIAWSGAVVVFVKYAKLWELERRAAPSEGGDGDHTRGEGSREPGADKELEPRATSARRERG